MKIRSYKGAGVFLIRFEHDRFEVLLGKRSIKQGYGTWSIPGGGVEKKDTSFQDCAFRELKEETGVDLKHVQHRVLGRCVKDVPFFHWNSYIVFMWGNEPVMISQEFSKLEWVSLDKVKDYELFIGLGAELRAARRLLKKYELEIERIAGIPLTDEQLRVAYKTVCTADVSTAVALQRHMGIGKQAAEKLYLDLMKRGWRYCYGKEEK